MLTSVNEGKHFGGSLKPAFSGEKTKMLMIEGFPIFVSLFLNVYIGNAPKYAIDACLTEEIQAYYNFIFMPVFAIGMFANFIFNPILVKLAHRWDENRMVFSPEKEEMILRNSALCRGSRPEVGSSRISTCGSPHSDWARPTRCR